MRGEDPEAVIRLYRANAAQLGGRFNSLAPDAVFAPVAQYLPENPQDVLDIGAGSGRDAAWFAAMGHRVTAAEPVAKLGRHAAGDLGAGRLDWVEDRLPDLGHLTGRAASYDLVLVVAVWHHLSPALQTRAMARIVRLMRPGARLIMSLRHGPGADGQTVFQTDAGATIRLAENNGLTLVALVAAGSVQQAGQVAGVTWDWLVLDRAEAQKQ